MSLMTVLHKFISGVEHDIDGVDFEFDGHLTGLVDQATASNKQIMDKAQSIIESSERIEKLTEGIDERD